MKTPILFIIFNRMDTTKKVFEKIREAKPPRLYIASDGARTDKQNEKKTVKAIRNYVISNIDWTCEIITLFRDVNKGCGYHIADAVTWFFVHLHWLYEAPFDNLPSMEFPLVKIFYHPLGWPNFSGFLFYFRCILHINPLI